MGGGGEREMVTLGNLKDIVTQKVKTKLTGISISPIVERHANFNEDSGWQSLKALVNACNQ